MRELPPARGAGPERALLPTARTGVRRLPARPAARVHHAPRRSSATYAYFSSYSDSWVQHAADFVETAVERLGLGPGLVRGRGGEQRRLPAPARRRARHPLPRHRAGRQRRRGRGGEGRPDRGVVPRRGDRSGRRGAPRTGGPRGRPTTCSPTCRTSSTSAEGCAPSWPTSGTVSIEIPHLLRLIEGNEYDTIYHEHFSYLSLLTTQRVLAAAGLTVVDVDELPTHGGSLRTWSMPTEHAVEPCRRGRAGARRRGGRRAAHARGPRRFRQRGRGGTQRPRRVPHRAEPRGQAGRGVRRARQGQHPAEPLRHPGRPGGVQRSTATRTSTGRSCPGRTSRSIRSRRSPRHGPTTC